MKRSPHLQRAVGRQNCQSREEDEAIRYCGGRTRRSHAVAFLLLMIPLIGLLWWFDPTKTTVSLCGFHAMTGLDCPGCGALRATHALLHGRLLTALRYNALWVLSLPLVVYVVVSELRVLAGRRPLPGDLPRQTWFWGAAILAAIVFFVARNISTATQFLKP